MGHKTVTTKLLDESITFYMQTYDDQEYAFFRAKQIRAMYPGAQMIVCLDGGDPKPLPWVEFAVEFYEEERLFTVVNGGKVVQRTRAA